MQTNIDIIKLGGVKPSFKETTRSTIERALKHWRA